MPVCLCVFVCVRESARVCERIVYVWFFVCLRLCVCVEDTCLFRGRTQYIATMHM